jgi:hypothetical protein
MVVGSVAALEIVCKAGRKSAGAEQRRGLDRHWVSVSFIVIFCRLVSRGAAPGT